MLSCGRKSLPRRMRRNSSPTPTKLDHVRVAGIEPRFNASFQPGTIHEKQRNSHAGQQCGPRGKVMREKFGAVTNQGYPGQVTKCAKDKRRSPRLTTNACCPRDQRKAKARSQINQVVLTVSQCCQDG